jgi:hypothetical protein
MVRIWIPILGSLALVSACAQRPAPIVPEPIYDKFGNLEDVCVSDEQLGDPTYQPPLRPLPRCEDRCEEGERPTFTVAGQWPICIRIPEDDGGEPDPNDPRPLPN